MAIPLLPILLLLGGGTAVAALVAAKNVRGEDVKLGRRAVEGFWGTPGADGRMESGWFYAFSNGAWHTGKSPTFVESTATKGKASSRWAALVQASSSAYNTGIDTDSRAADWDGPTSDGEVTDAIPLFFDFVDHADTQGAARGLIFRVSIIPSVSGWLVQVLDPRATVALLKGGFSNRTDAMKAGYDFVEKAGY